MGARLVVPASALALLLAGCPSATEQSADSSRPTTSPEPTPLDSVTAANACPTASSSAPRCIAEVRTDLDADRKPDRFVIHAEPGPSGRSRGWRAEALLAAGPRSAIPIALVHEEQPPGILGVVDADGDGRDEVFVQVDQGASTSFIDIFHVVGDRLQKVRANGRDITFSLGGSVTHGAGIECRDVDGKAPAELIQVGASSEDGEVHRWVENIYRWSEGNLILWKTNDGILRGDPRDPEFDTKLGRFYELRCVDLEVGQ